MATSIFPRSSPVKFWSSDQAQWNFGDALTLIFLDELFYDLGADDLDIRLIGSTIADGLVPTGAPRLQEDVAPWRSNVPTKVLYWGCGVREPGGLSEHARNESDILTVRGPLSASALRLGATVPQGEPGLLLPALYNPKILSHFVGRTVCIPHYNDDRPDLHFLTETGCDVVLRPNLRTEKSAILEFIDAIHSADFVLSAALHGAVTAVAYGKPFAYWSNGHLDVPFKWDDFAALVQMPSRFASNLAEARDIYAGEIAESIRIPSLWGLLLRTPLLLREKGVVSVLVHELRKIPENGRQSHLEAMLRDLQAHGDHFEKLKARVGNVSSSYLAGLWETKQKETERADAAGREAQQLRDEAQQLREEARNKSDRADVASREVQQLRGEVHRLSEEARSESHRADAACRENQKLREEPGDGNNRIDATDRDAQQLQEVVAIDSNQAAAVSDEAQQLREEMLKEREEHKRELDAATTKLVRSSFELQAKTRELQFAGEAKHQLARKMGRKWDRYRSTFRNRLSFIGLGNSKARRMSGEMRLIGDFLDEFDGSFVRVSAAGRRERIVSYLMGFTEYLADFPFLRNAEYRDMYVDVAEAGLSPLVHYIAFGRKENRSVHPLFDTGFYLSRYPEAQHLSSCPALHYLQWGAQKGYNPHPLFDTNDYRRRYPDVSQTGYNPLLHWLDSPLCMAHPLFDCDYYLEHNRDVTQSGRNPLAHYLQAGWREGRNPHPLFDTAYYLQSNPDVRAVGLNPLVHYVTSGYLENRRPSANFDPASYVARHPDAAGSNINPLVHCVEFGGAAGVDARTSGALTAIRPVTIAADARPVVLMIDAFFPRPDHDSGSLDQVAFVKIFHMLGYEVHFISVLEFAALRDGASPKYIQGLTELGATCIRSNEYDHIESYLFLNSERIRAAFVSRVDFGGAYISTLRRLCPSTKVIFNTVDLHFVREEREAALKNDNTILDNARNTRERELAAITTSDAVVVVSSTEKQLLMELAPLARIAVIPLMREFSSQKPVPFEQRHDIAFVGGFLHQPNVDAVEHFLETTWPIVQKRRSDIRFRVIGSNMPPVMKERTKPGVDFIGYVADVEQELAKVRLTVAPLRYGAGAKGKLVSSLGNGVPSVASAVAVEGMGLTDRQEVLVANLPSEFADRIIELHDNPALWTELSERGLDFIRGAYSIEAGRDIVADLFEELDVHHVVGPAEA